MGDHGAAKPAAAHVDHGPQSRVSAIPRFHAVLEFDHGKRIFQPADKEAIGLSPSCFRSGGKKHTPAPYSCVDSARDIIAAQRDSFGLVSEMRLTTPSERRKLTLEAAQERASAMPALSPRRPATGQQHASPRGAVATPEDMQEASARRQERRLLESLIAFPSSAAAARGLKPSLCQPSVPRAFTMDNVEWKPTTPHAHPPPLPESAPKPPPKPLLVNEEGKITDERLERLARPPRRPKPVTDKVPIHTYWKPGANGEKGSYYVANYDPKNKVKYDELVTKLISAGQHTAAKIETKRKARDKEEAAMVKYDGGKHKVTEANITDFTNKFSAQPINTRAVKFAALQKKYAPPLKTVYGDKEAKKFQSGEQKASVNRLYSGGLEKQKEAWEKAFVEHVEKSMPRAVKLPPEQLKEMADRLSGKESPR